MAWSLRRHIQSVLVVILFAAAMAPDVGEAAKGSCEYRLYSEFRGRSLLVCQTADNASQCGIWPRSNPNSKVMAYAEGKSENRVAYRPQQCEAARAVAVCNLPNSHLYFYEGDQKDLDWACMKMSGTFKSLAPLPATLQSQTE